MKVVDRLETYRDGHPITKVPGNSVAGDPESFCHLHDVQLCPFTRTGRTGLL